MKWLLAALLLAGCVDAKPAASNGIGSLIYKWHDDAASVTCWVYNGPETGASLSCIPDKDLER